MPLGYCQEANCIFIKNSTREAGADLFDGGCGIRPSAAGAVPRKNSPPDCFLTRGLRIPSIHHKNKQHLQKQMLFILAEGVGFEPTWDCSQTVFKTYRSDRLLGILLELMRSCWLL